MPRPAFKAIKLSASAAPIVERHIKQDNSFAENYRKLDETSDLHDEDIYVQRFGSGNGLNFQVIDVYTQETKYYLAADSNPASGIKKAVKAYNDFVTATPPPKNDLPSRSEVTGKPTAPEKHNKRWFFGLL